jgi:hypothetical protein
MNRNSWGLFPTVFADPVFEQENSRGIPVFLLHSHHIQPTPKISPPKHPNPALGPRRPTFRTPNSPPTPPGRLCLPLPQVSTLTLVSTVQMAAAYAQPPKLQCPISSPPNERILDPVPDPELPDARPPPAAAPKRPGSSTTAPLRLTCGPVARAPSTPHARMTPPTQGAGVAASSTAKAKGLLM